MASVREGEHSRCNAPWRPGVLVTSGWRPRVLDELTPQMVESHLRPTAPVEPASQFPVQATAFPHADVLGRDGEDQNWEVVEGGHISWPRAFGSCLSSRSAVSQKGSKIVSWSASCFKDLTVDIPVRGKSLVAGCKSDKRARGHLPDWSFPATANCGRNIRRCKKCLSLVNPAATLTSKMIETQFRSSCGAPRSLCLEV